MLNIFKSKRRELIEKRAQLQASAESARAARAMEIERLQSEPDFLIYQHALKIQRDIGKLQEQDREKTSAEHFEIEAVTAEIRATVGDKVAAFLKWAQDEKERAGKQIVAKGTVERNRLGMPVGHLITNEQKIRQYLGAIDEAVLAVRRLEISPSDDIGTELKNIRAALPILDAQPEQIDCDAGFAAALS